MKFRYITALVACGLLAYTGSANALMTSSTYRLYGDELGAGGNRSTSTSYILQDSTGGLATGDLSSTNYTLLSGFQSLSEHPTFTFSVSSATVDFGQLSVTSVSTGSHTLTTSTNASLGFTTIATADGDLRAGASTIDAVADGSVTAGSEEYGISLSGTDRAFADDEAPTTSGLTVASRSSWKNSSTITVTYKASVTNGTAGGSYQQVITYVSTGNF